jgi:hypothetical protein
MRSPGATQAQVVTKRLIEAKMARLVNANDP